MNTQLTISIYLSIPILFGFVFHDMNHILLSMMGGASWKPLIMVVRKNSTSLHLIVVVCPFINTKVNIYLNLLNHNNYIMLSNST